MTECKMCGECCKAVFFGVRGIRRNRKLVEYFETRGCEVMIVGGKEGVLIPSVCQHLTEDNKCSIYGDRPEACRVFQGQSGYYVPPECVFNKRRKNNGS